MDHFDDLDAREFDEFYLRSRNRVAVQIAALTGNPAAAVEHVQEAYIRAWARWTYVGGLDDPEAWVRRVAHHLAVGRWRRARRRVVRAAPTGSIRWDDDQRAVVDALRLLPPRQREAIVLHHLVGRSVDEVAADLDAPARTVRSWLSRGRRQLATVLSAAPMTEEVPS